jgi:hypothetical protein
MASSISSVAGETWLLMMPIKASDSSVPPFFKLVKMLDNGFAGMKSLGLSGASRQTIEAVFHFGRQSKRKHDWLLCDDV